MSAQAGIWNFDGRPVDRTLLGGFSEALKQQGPDGEFCHAEGSIALLYRPFNTTAESRREKQPYVSSRGFVITWDGRLDNREELAVELRHEVTADATDVALFAAAFDRWESACFRRIIGDWAVSVWKPQERELIFACDFMAIRHIFYYLKNDRIWWSTDLTPLVLLAGDKFHIDDEYIAGYFAHDPEAHLTPYREIRQVPPGQFVRVRNNRGHIERYWKFSPKSRIRYKSDAEYEEHFQYVFRQSVRRRLRSDSPILAELSGGLDSSSIVCMADDILMKEGVQAPRLDTLSYYDSTEPRGDDYLYFPKIEHHRGRVGHHFDISQFDINPDLQNFTEFHALPNFPGFQGDFDNHRSAILNAGGYKVVLSGVGGDEFLGGIPNPSTQLADLIAQCKISEFARLLIAWSLVKRQPCTHLLWQALLDLLPCPIKRYVLKQARVEPWVDSQFAKRVKKALSSVEQNHENAISPARRSCMDGILLMSRKLAKWSSLRLRAEEDRYPYLDQGLLEFIVSIPATQLLRPYERRSLMRRSLIGLVPLEVLSRTTKQVGVRTPLIGLQHSAERINHLFDSPISSNLGFVESPRLLELLRDARNGMEVHLIRIFRAIALEIWLRQLVSRQLIANTSRLTLQQGLQPVPSGC